jgi:hypothetical protein
MRLQHTADFRDALEARLLRPPTLEVLVSQEFNA